MGVSEILMAISIAVGTANLVVDVITLVLKLSACTKKPPQDEDLD